MGLQQILPFDLRVDLEAMTTKGFYTLSRTEVLAPDADSYHTQDISFCWVGVLPPLQGLQIAHSRHHQQGKILVGVV